MPESSLPRCKVCPPRNEWLKENDESQARQATSRENVTQLNQTCCQPPSRKYFWLRKSTQADYYAIWVGVVGRKKNFKFILKNMMMITEQNKLYVTTIREFVDDWWMEWSVELSWSEKRQIATETRGGIWWGQGKSWWLDYK